MFLDQIFKNCMHSYDHECNMHTKDIWHGHKFVHSIDFPVKKKIESANPPHRTL